jgi:hypothetical protein
MRLLAYSLGVVSLLSALAARASDDMQVYSGGQSALAQLAGGPHGLAIAIADKQSWYKLGQRHKFGADEYDGNAGGPGERRGVFPVGTSLVI